MQLSLTCLRIAAAALAVLALGAGITIQASPAAADDDSSLHGRGNTVSIGAVLPATGKAITIVVTYSCAPSSELYLSVVWRLADARDAHVRSPRGVGTVYHPGLTCDGQKHDVQVTVPVLLDDSLPFGTGDPVRVTVQLSNPEGAPYARTERVTTL
ncbi:hypothetical protein ABT160_10025 [Streptomyces sp. NPDC001941]|uniref:hypothetical protein n=1 Tax=Streptomyces sp. NPDC001941 TaxID=3154659 RepID=UPI00332F00E0